ncbi:hypothetical protein ACJX0J_014447, partial [Zea mays]
MYNISSKHVTWSLKEKIGDRYNQFYTLNPENVITASSDYTVKLQLTLQGQEVVDGYEVKFRKKRYKTQNLAANKYKGEGMGQENSSVLKKVQIYNNILITKATINELFFFWLPKNPVMKFKNTSYDRFNVWSLNYKHSNHYYNTIYITLEEVRTRKIKSSHSIKWLSLKQEFCVGFALKNENLFGRNQGYPVITAAVAGLKIDQSFINIYNNIQVQVKICTLNQNTKHKLITIILFAQHGSSLETTVQ